MSYSGGTAPYAAHTSQPPPPRWPGRQGPPLWLGVLLLVGAPVVYFVGVVAWIFPAVDTAAREGTRPIVHGEPFAVRHDSDYIVLSPVISSCTVKLPGEPRQPLRQGLRESNDWPIDGQSYWQQGFFDVPRDGRAKVFCTGDAPLAVARWEGNLTTVVRVSRYGGYAALVAALLGILMIVLRRKRPIW